MVVLVAIGADEMQPAVLDEAVELAKAFDEGLYVVHLTAGTEASAAERNIRNEIQNRLENEQVTYSISLEHGNRSGKRSGEALGQQLADIATDVDISRIVIGYRSKGFPRNLVDGNTAFAVIAATDVPVTVVSHSPSTGG